MSLVWKRAKDFPRSDSSQNISWNERQNLESSKQFLPTRFIGNWKKLIKIKKSNYYDKRFFSNWKDMLKVNFAIYPSFMVWKLLFRSVSLLSSYADVKFSMFARKIKLFIFLDKNLRKNKKSKKNFNGDDHGSVDNGSGFGGDSDHTRKEF